MYHVTVNMFAPRTEDLFPVGGHRDYYTCILYKFNSFQFIAAQSNSSIEIFPRFFSWPIKSKA